MPIGYSRANLASREGLGLGRRTRKKVQENWQASGNRSPPLKHHRRRTAQWSLTRPTKATLAAVVLSFALFAGVFNLSRFAVSDSFCSDINIPAATQPVTLPGRHGCHYQRPQEPQDRDRRGYCRIRLVSCGCLGGIVILLMNSKRDRLRVALCRIGGHGLDMRSKARVCCGVIVVVMTIT